MDTVRKTIRWALPFVVVLIIVVIALVAWTPAEATMDSSISLYMVPSTHLATSLRPAADDSVLGEAPTPETDALTAYLYESMRAWTEVPENDPPGDEARAARNAAMRARLASTASDITAVVRSEAGAPLFEGDRDLSRTAVLVAAVAFYESGYRDYVDRGLCNDWSWRHPKTTGPGAVSLDEVKQRRAILLGGSCDGGFAYSDWQIHPFDAVYRDGVVLLDGQRAWAFAADISDGVKRDVIRGSDMIADRRKAVRVALHMLRRATLPGRTNLCGYTGEMEAGCPKGAKRLNFALDWSRKHPFEHGID